MSPVVSSMRSRQTGQVGSSIRLGVGGGNGFMELTRPPADAGPKGSLFNDDAVSFGCVGVSMVIDLINVT